MDKNIFIGRTIRIFLSYSTKDKILASKIKDWLEEYGLEIFLAHEDIRPSEEWQSTIIKRLKSCDIFIPLLTSNFKSSDWTDQESGIAFSEGKIIIPLRVELNPYGFIGRYQGLKIDKSRVKESCLSIIGIILNKPELKENMIDSIITSFVNSNSFNEAAIKSKLLLQFDSLREEQLNEIFRGSIRNNQIFSSFKAKKNLHILIERFKGKFDKELQNKF